MFSRISLRRMAIMLVGIFIMGLGITLFKLSVTGNGPSTAFAIAFADRVGVEFPLIMIGFNSLYFIAELIWGRHLIGAGTFVNWFGVGTAAGIWLTWLESVVPASPSFGLRMMLMGSGVLVLSFAGALYQTAAEGIAPYDCLSLILSERLHLPYFPCRMATDAACVAATALLGGVVGLGTLLCVFGLGPFISFFTATVARPLCGIVTAQ